MPGRWWWYEQKTAWAEAHPTIFFFFFVGVKIADGNRGVEIAALPAAPRNDNLWLLRSDWCRMPAGGWRYKYKFLISSSYSESHKAMLRCGISR